MTNEAKKQHPDAVSFTRKQVLHLANVAGVTPEDVREAQRSMHSKTSFLMSLAYVHMLRHPVITRIEDQTQRSFAAVRESSSLRAVWQGDKAVKSIVDVGRLQAKTGHVVREEPVSFATWLERVWANNEAAPAAAPRI